MDRQTHLICENAQYITLIAWPIIYGDDNKYDQDSRNVMETIRDWAEAFENWWQLHDEEWMEVNDYLSELEKFTEEKAEKYIEPFKNNR